MNWLELENQDGKKLPAWMRSLGVSSDGTIFVPAAMGGREEEVFLCTAYDGTESLTYLNHVFVPSTWLAKEFPDTQELCKVMENRAQNEIANGIFEG